MITLPTKEVETTLPTAVTKPLETKKEYRVISFAFVFKTGTSKIVASPEGIYTPANKEEKDFLDFQVKKQNISYS